MHVFQNLPAMGAWKLSGAYEGFEVVRFVQSEDQITLEGTSVGVEAGVPWSIQYRIDVDADWRFRRATITDNAGNQRVIEVNEAGSWLVDGQKRPDLDGYTDLDLEASTVTNTLPVHRLKLREGQQGESAAVYIRTQGLAVEQLNQTYRYLSESEGQHRFAYDSPRFDYHEILCFGADGLAVTYPGIGTRVV